MTRLSQARQQDAATSELNYVWLTGCTCYLVTSTWPDYVSSPAPRFAQFSAIQFSSNSIWAVWQANICGNRRASAVASRTHGQKACSTCCTPAGASCNRKGRKPLQMVNRKSFLIFSATHPSIKVSGASGSAELCLFIFLFGELSGAGHEVGCCCQLIEPIVSFKVGRLICLSFKFGLSARRNERLGSASASSGSVGQLRQLLQPSLLRLSTRSINWQQLQFSMARRTTIGTECPAILKVG